MAYVSFTSSKILSNLFAMITSLGAPKGAHPRAAPGCVASASPAKIIPLRTNLLTYFSK